MWYLNREEGLNMNVEGAWNEGVSGKGVAVTILDDGIEKDHPDLVSRIDVALRPGPTAWRMKAYENIFHTPKVRQVRLGYAKGTPKVRLVRQGYAKGTP